MLLEDVDPAHFGPGSSIAVLDERYSSDATVNNFAQLEKTAFYERVREKGTNFIDTKVRAGKSMGDLARRFENDLRDWVARTKGTIIATVGVGPDEHTSGIMPYPEDPQFFETTFNDDARWIAAYDAGAKSPHRMRVTTTLPFLRKIDSAIIFATGDAKKSAFEKMLAERGSLAESPCRIWREIPGTELYTDIRL